MFSIFQAAQAVLIALFNLNSPEFSMMLSVLPKTFQVCIKFLEAKVKIFCSYLQFFFLNTNLSILFQDGATKILHSHLRSASQESDFLAPRNVSSPSTQSNYRYNRNTSNRYV